MGLNKLSKAPVEQILISKVEPGIRRRKKMGPLQSLAANIDQNGLIHPIVVRGDGNGGYELVVGGRRLEACKAKLGWRRIPARNVDKMSDEERRTLELDENEVRLDLDPYEASKGRLKEIEAAESEIEAEKPAQKGQVSVGGRGKRGGDAEVSRRTGLSRGEIQRTRQHVETATAWPAMQGNDWKKSQVLAASEHIAEIDNKHHSFLNEMISEPGIPAKLALRMLDHFSQKLKLEQNEVKKLYESDDPKKQMLAKTRTANVPPPIPAFLTRLNRIEYSLKREVDEIPTKYRRLILDALALLQDATSGMNDDYQAFKAKEMGK